MHEQREKRKLGTKGTKEGDERSYSQEHNIILLSSEHYSLPWGRTISAWAQGRYLLPWYIKHRRHAYITYFHLRCRWKRTIFLGVRYRTTNKEKGKIQTRSRDDKGERERILVEER